MTLAVFAATEHYIVRAKVIILGSPLKYTLCISSIDGNRLFIITEDLKKKKTKTKQLTSLKALTYRSSEVG